MKRWVLLFIFVGCLLSSDIADAQTRLVIIDLGTLGGSMSAAYGINDVGQVVGTSQTVSSAEHAFLWAVEDGMQALPEPYDLEYGDVKRSHAYGINGRGQIVGQIAHSIPNPDAPSWMAFRWTLAGGQPELDIPGVAYGINELGQVVGLGDAGAFLWTESDGLHNLGSLGPGLSVARDINDSGQVVGWIDSDYPSDVYRSFLWTAEGGMQDLGTLGGFSSAAYAVNDLGQVVGWSEIATGSGKVHAYLWTAEGGMQDLGTLGGVWAEARAINDLGQVVGWSNTASGEKHAFLWTAEDGMQDLGNLSGGDSQAFGINNLGQIVGSSDGHAVLWRFIDVLQAAYLPLVQS